MKDIRNKFSNTFGEMKIVVDKSLQEVIIRNFQNKK